MLTVYGIETQVAFFNTFDILSVATVLTVYGIETHNTLHRFYCRIPLVATVLTVYGIETFICSRLHLVMNQLQQCLPFTVLKPGNTICAVILS